MHDPAPRIAVVFHSVGNCPTQFAVDLAKAMRYSGTIIPFAIHEQSCYVDTARNRLVEKFLGSEATHMMMVDVDLSFEADAFLKTFAILESQQLDLLYGNYALGNASNSIFWPPTPKTGEAGVAVQLEPGKVYTGIATGGTGWLMTRRSLLERMRRECPGPWHWFARDLTADGKDFRGEDVSFGLRVNAMTPQPKVAGTTALVLRHFKQQPFVPEFMQREAGSRQLYSLAFPNPYEADPEKYLCFNNTVLVRADVDPDVLKAVEAEIQAREVASAIQRSAAEIQSGQAPQRLGDRAEGDLPQASPSDHAQREAEGGGGEDRVSTHDCEGQQEEGFCRCQADGTPN